MEYQQIAAWWLLSLFSTVVLFFGGGCPGTAGVVVTGLVFGTLLGPEATGPGEGVYSLSGFVCFWFPGCIDHARWPLVGLCVGCVVWGCCLRTT